MSSPKSLARAGTDAGSVRPVAIGQVGCYLQRRNCGAHPSQNENHPPCILSNQNPNFGYIFLKEEHNNEVCQY